MDPRMKLTKTCSKKHICVELASLGEESLFMSINLKQRSCFYLGSEPGKEFLTKRMDVIENFYHFINISNVLYRRDF
uniref:Uncharacterized protein n=1 Tax=Magallana gigas TaxID=29159 RepID=K1QEJ6_MAGGI